MMTIALTLVLAAAPNGKPAPIALEALTFDAPASTTNSSPVAAPTATTPLVPAATKAAAPTWPSAPSTSESAGAGWQALVFLALVAAAGAALAVQRRKSARAPTRTLRVVEHIAVGRGRALWLIEVQGQRVLVGTSEAGVTAVGGPLPTSSSVDPIREEEAPGREPSAAASLLRVFGRRGEPAFAAELARSFDDDELQKKMARVDGTRA